MFAEVDFRDTALAEAVERVLQRSTAEGEAENPEVSADEGFDLNAVFPADGTFSGTVSVGADPASAVGIDQKSCPLSSGRTS